MKSRLLIIIGIIVLPLVFPQGFSQCIYNYDWPDAPCFDMGPVSHLKFYTSWTPYYDYKGAEWMETKKVEMNQSLENEIIEEWVKELENYNAYRYYLSRNEIPSSLPYDRLAVNLDPNFTTRESISDEDVCGPDAIIVDGICQMKTPSPLNCIGYVFGYALDECLLLWYVVLAVALSIIVGIIVMIRRKRK